MARETTKKVEKKIGVALFEIEGEVTKIYVGRKRVYFTIKVSPADSEYYSVFTVSVDPDSDDEHIKEGDIVRIRGEMSSKYDKERQCTLHSFSGEFVGH